MTKQAKTYAVRARRSGSWWALDVPDLPGVFSQVHRLDQADAMARDAIATMLDTSPTSLTVEIHPVLDDAELARAVERFRALQERQAALQAELNDVAAGTATRFVERGYTLRDAGRVMGLSFQRVHQLANQARRDKLGQARRESAGVLRGGPHAMTRRQVAARVDELRSEETD